MRNYLVTFLFSFLFLINLVAQNSTNAPISMFGIGELFSGDGGQFSGMGGVAIGMRTDNFINPANPASLTALPDRHIVLDAGMMAGYESYKQTGARNSSVVGNLNNLGIGFRVVPRVYTAVYLAPVSSVGYAITMTQEIQGTVASTTTSLFEGEGGLSRIGLTGGFLITPRLSVGVNLAYISGTITQTETQGSSYETIKSYKYNFYSDFGLQYELSLAERDRSLTFGVVYGYNQQLKQDNEIYVYNSSSGDVINSNSRRVKQYMPEFIGAGVGYFSLKNSITGEYKFVDWTSSQSSYSTVKYTKQHLIKLGGSYVVGNPYKSPVRLMLGTGYQNSYITIKGENAKNYYVSTGVSFGLRNKSVISVGVKYKDQLNRTASLPREQTVSAYLNISFLERIYRSRVQ